MVTYRTRRVSLIVTILFSLVVFLIVDLSRSSAPIDTTNTVVKSNATGQFAIDQLQKIPIKGRAPKTGYSRDQFGSGWASDQGCDTRNRILMRDLEQPALDDNCLVTRGKLNDPYTGREIDFKRSQATSSLVQIDHVVALSNAWQTGAQQLSFQRRQEFANDPLNLLAVDGSANQQKSDGDAATWLPSYKPFRCQYVARQIAVKASYSLWVTSGEAAAMQRILTTCPDQRLPVP